MNSRRLVHPVSVSGVAIHSGLKTSASVYPGVVGRGVVFVRHGISVTASASLVSGVDRCTSLQIGPHQVMMVEHLLAALWLLGIEDATVVMNGDEMPVLDGSAQQWTALLTEASVPTGRSRVRKDLSEPVELHAGASHAWVLPACAPCINVTVHFNHPLVRSQTGAWDLSQCELVQTFARARTFGFIEEVQPLLDRGMALGGALDNALVIYPDHYSSELRYPDEPLRHKALDFIGDMALIGCAVNACFVVIRPGHKFNNALARAVSAQLDATSA